MTTFKPWPSAIEVWRKTKFWLGHELNGVQCALGGRRYLTLQKLEKTLTSTMTSEREAGCLC
jgi:hypothetical protein